MPQLSTGYVIAGAYAQKIRKVVFAQLKDKIKSGELSNKDVVKQIGELNSYLYHILVEDLKLDKGDIVRIRINYDIIGKDIIFDYDSLEIEAFKRIPVMLNVKLKKVAENEIGDILYSIEKNGKEIGVIVVSKVDGEFIIKGAILEPPKKIPNVKLISQTSEPSLSDVLYHAETTDEETAKKIIEELKAEFK